MTAADSLKPHQREGLRWLQVRAPEEGPAGVYCSLMTWGWQARLFRFSVFCSLVHGIDRPALPDSCTGHPRPGGRYSLLCRQCSSRAEAGKAIWSVSFATAELFSFPSSPSTEASSVDSGMDLQGREVAVGRPLLDLDALQAQSSRDPRPTTRSRIIQHSFACLRPDGRSLWSVVVTDEAQEYKVPNTKALSHAVKALQPDFHIASTGTPVENPASRPSKPLRYPAAGPPR